MIVLFAKFAFRRYVGLNIIQLFTILVYYNPKQKNYLYFLTPGFDHKIYLSIFFDGKIPPYWFSMTLLTMDCYILHPLLLLYIASILVQAKLTKNLKNSFTRSNILVLLILATIIIKWL